MDLTGREVYLLQVIEASAPHRVVRFATGDPVEREWLVAATDEVMARIPDVTTRLERILEQGVGVFKTTAQVEAVLRAELETHTLEVRAAVLAGQLEALRALKWETVSL